MVLVGHSLGAQVAVHFAARHTARVRGLALIDPVFHQALRGTMRTVRLARPVLQITRAMLAENPRTQAVTIDAYHWPLTENPLQVRAAIETWCLRMFS